MIDLNLFVSVLSSILVCSAVAKEFCWLDAWFYFYWMPDSFFFHTFSNFLYHFVVRSAIFILTIVSTGNIQNLFLVKINIQQHYTSTTLRFQRLKHDTYKYKSFDWQTWRLILPYIVLHWLVISSSSRIAL